MIPAQAPRTLTLALALSAILLAGGPLATIATADMDDAPELPYGSHIVTRVSASSTEQASVLVVESPDDEVILYAVAQVHSIFVSDGIDDDGERPWVEVPGATIGVNPHRLDVVLHGPTYTLQVDQGAAVTARTFVDTTTGRPAADPEGIIEGPGVEVVQTRVRVDNDDMAYDTTFSEASGLGGWTLQVGEPPEPLETVDEDVALVNLDGGHRLRAGLRGHDSAGFLELFESRFPGATYLHAPVPTTPGPFLAEASFDTDGARLIPHGMAVLAGLSGPVDYPAVHWAIVAAPTPTDIARTDPQDNADEWTLHYQAADGTRTQVMDPVTRTFWHGVVVRADEATGTLTVTVDGGTPFIFAHNGLGSVERIGAGDVTADPFEELEERPNVGVVGQFDDLAVYAEAVP